MEFTIMHLFLVNLFLVFITHSVGRSTERGKDPEEEVEIKLIVKRDAPLDSQELPFVEGRTHRASEPINPNSETEQSDSPQSLHEDAFETSQTIFQPEVDNDEGSDTDTQFVPEVTDGGEGEDRDSLTRSEVNARGYSAQYPYHQTTNDGQASLGGSPSGTFTSSSSGYHPSGSETLTTRRRVQTYGSSSGRYVDGRVSGTSTSGQYRGSNHRYQNGRYYDSAGHIVDQHGRHIDSSGRLIDSSSSSGSTSQGFPTTYDPIVSQISNDPNCPSTNVRVRINGLTCRDALSQLGHFVCYNYERVTTECCERCLQVKNPSQVGCEYGDRSYQCRNIQPFDCYVERNRQICCEKCREFREQRALTGNADHNCEYGDLTPRCLNVRQRSHLCYLSENQRLCCDTCRRLENDEENDCRWGNQSPELCQPFDPNGQLRLNCYIQTVQEVCCATCKRLEARMRDQVPGCEYGDAPVQFSTGSEILDCVEYIRQFGVQNCEDSEIATKCCYTCHRYRASGRG